MSNRIPILGVAISEMVRKTEEGDVPITRDEFEPGNTDCWPSRQVTMSTIQGVRINSGIVDECPKQVRGPRGVPTGEGEGEGEGLVKKRSTDNYCKRKPKVLGQWNPGRMRYRPNMDCPEIVAIFGSVIPDTPLHEAVLALHDLWTSVAKAVFDSWESLKVIGFVLPNLPEEDYDYDPDNGWDYLIDRALWSTMDTDIVAKHLDRIATLKGKLAVPVSK